MSLSARTRASLTHPVIDADAHLLEFEPAYYEYIRAEGGEAALKAFRGLSAMAGEWYAASDQRRRHERIQRPAFGLPSKNTFDFATTMLPKLLYSRLDAIGIDYMIVNPTIAFAYVKLPDVGLRRSIARAINRCHADMMRDLSDRMTIAAVVPMVTPEEAIAELEYAVETLGFKVICVDNAARRPIPAFAEKYPDAPPSIARHARWIDTYGLDSPYDYDPFWKRCVELKVNLTSHMPGYWGSRTSTASYVYNHVGQFADSGEALLKAMLLGGVTHRFPKLKFGFLEGGVGWGCRVYCDLIEHYEKRNAEAMEAFHFDHFDEAMWKALTIEHGGPQAAGMLKGSFEETCPALWGVAGWTLKDRAQLDEWKQSGIDSKESIRDTFMSNFYFGCEADDRTVAWAFDDKVLPKGAKLRAMFGSDIGHWDVTDVETVLHEAHKLVDKGLLNLDQFRDFTFGNVASFYKSTNPDFFKGTSVESAV
jgi:predicted TIM-barrel fold metal-dependent hydrolase